MRPSTALSTAWFFAICPGRRRLRAVGRMALAGHDVSAGAVLGDQAHDAPAHHFRRSPIGSADAAPIERAGYRRPTEPGADGIMRAHRVSAREARFAERGIDAA